MSKPALDFDVDHYINRFVPRPRLHILPRPISWFLGYRSEPIPRIGSVVVWFYAFIGAFIGLIVVQAVFQTNGIKDHGAPTVIASLVRNPLQHRCQVVLSRTRVLPQSSNITQLTRHSLNRVMQFSVNYSQQSSAWESQNFSN
jgi:hypothetical protein